MATTAPLELTPVFPTPFASGVLAGHDALARYALDLRPSSAARTGPWEGPPNLFDHPVDAVQAFKRDVGEALGALVADLGEYSGDEIAGLRVQSRAWAAVVEPGDGLSLRAHSMASWCAAYWVQAPEFDAARPNGGALSLYDPRLGNMYQDAGNSRLRMPFGFGHFATRAAPGRLAVFPACVPHEVMPIRGTVPLIMVFALFRFVNVGGGART